GSLARTARTAATRLPSVVGGEIMKPTQRSGGAVRCVSYAGALAMFIGTVSGLASSDVNAAILPVVTPVLACADLLQLDFTGLEGAPTKLDTAAVEQASAAAPSEQCVVTGYVASKVKFTVRMPTKNWTQRLMMQGCGGYCGDLINTFTSY